MKLILIVTILSTLAFNAYAENGIEGKWHDKSDPNAHVFEFKKGQDFIYTHKWTHQGETKTNKSIGVWESGLWNITRTNGNKSTCNLTIYADTKECCFDYKYIASNLILTIKHTDDGYAGTMCDNRVLVKKQ